MKKQLFFLSFALSTFLPLPSSANSADLDWTKVPVARRVHAYYEIETRVMEAKNRHFWYTLPAELPYQTEISSPNFSIQPSGIFTDVTFGNRVLYWNHEESERFSFRMDWEATIHNVLTNLDPAKIGAYDPNDKMVQLYTRSERLMHIDAKVLAIKAELEAELRGDARPLSVSKAAFRWVLDHMAYASLDDLDRDRGTDELLKRAFVHKGLTYYKGDCGEYTLLYNAILRSFGIPARTVTGGWSMGKDQWHVWSEVFFPGYGWVPVDTSAADVFVYDEGAELNALGEKQFGTFPQVTSPDFYFGNLDPYRFVMSVGNDIPLRPVMDWDFTREKAGWFYDRGNAGYMQVGVFHPLSLKDVKIRFENLP
ncbi:MAG: transglutaminase-like domain-containing protein [Bacteriovoracia bacterium]